MMSYPGGFQQVPSSYQPAHQLPNLTSVPCAPPAYSQGAPPAYSQGAPLTNYSQPNMNFSTPNTSFAQTSPSYFQPNSGQIQTSYMPSSSGYDHAVTRGNLVVPPPTMRTSECVSKVELTIRCNNLLDMDVFSKSDPLVVVLLDNRGHWIEKGRTENISNCLNPEFSKKIQLDYFFEETQKLRFSVYDIDNTTPSLEDDDFLGLAECSLGQIVSSSPLTLPLLAGVNGSRMGKSTITIYAEELDTGNKDLLLLTFRAERLDDLRWFSKSNPFLEIHKIDITGGLKMIHRTETVNRNLSPTWKCFELRRQALGGSNVETTVLIKCFDFHSSGSHELIGECSTTLGQILDAQNKTVCLSCINQKKKQRKGNSYVDSGLIYIQHCQILKAYSFLDYVLGGTQINFTVAVDFTASNGDPRDPKSLHYMHPNYPNEYIRAIMSVGGVVQDYDSDKQFPALGFGARIPPHFTVSHEFALNFNSSNPFCSGVQGLLQAYHSCLQQVQLYGPTNFAPVINHVAQFAWKAHQQTSPDDYFILLILTDGVVTDMQDTLRAVVKASFLPLSIIIVGVGKADFEQMEFLDADGTLLKAPDGTIAKRDIVQFVPFYKFEHGDPAMLAKEVLAELPQQLTDYYRWRNIPPTPQTALTS